jgi:predicted phosphate transport protein (TIGR00153 family)
MLDKLIPKNDHFFDAFDELANKIVEGAVLFQNLLQEGPPVETNAHRIKTAEEQADTIAHDTIERMHKTFVTPLEREDMFRLISRMDDIMDSIEEASVFLQLYEVETINPDALGFAEILVTATERVKDAVASLRNLKQPDKILQTCIEINRLENRADEQLKSALARLFREEKDVRTLLKWKDIYDSLENATDRCEDVANIIEGVVLEHA